MDISVVEFNSTSSAGAFLLSWLGWETKGQKHGASKLSCGSSLFFFFSIKIPFLQQQPFLFCCGSDSLWHLFGIREAAWWLTVATRLSECWRSSSSNLFSNEDSNSRSRLSLTSIYEKTFEEIFFLFFVFLRSIVFCI